MNQTFKIISSFVFLCLSLMIFPERVEAKSGATRWTTPLQFELVRPAGRNAPDRNRSGVPYPGYRTDDAEWKVRLGEESASPAPAPVAASASDLDQALQQLMTHIAHVSRQSNRYRNELNTERGNLQTAYQRLLRVLNQLKGRKQEYTERSNNRSWLYNQVAKWTSWNEDGTRMLNVAIQKVKGCLDNENKTKSRWGSYWSGKDGGSLSFAPPQVPTTVEPSVATEIDQQRQFLKGQKDRIFQSLQHIDNYLVNLQNIISQVERANTGGRRGGSGALNAALHRLKSQVNRSRGITRGLQNNEALTRDAEAQMNTWINLKQNYSLQQQIYNNNREIYYEKWVKGNNNFCSKYDEGSTRAVADPLPSFPPHQQN